MKSKWFKIYEKDKEFESKRKAKTISEAWEKTFEKWELIIDYYEPICHVETCGLCDLFHISEDDETMHCKKCPIYKKTKEQYCMDSPYRNWYDNSNLTSAKMELSFLRSVYKNSLKGKK